MSVEQSVDAMKQAFPSDQIALPGTEAFQTPNDV